MFSRAQWRRACVLVWLICNNHAVRGIEVVPLSQSPKVFFDDALALMNRAPVRPNASCPVDGQIACGNGTPDYFCCPNDKTCMVVASNTTALCCPEGASCEAISTIICDITAQDVVENPDSPIHTTKLDESLPKCGKQCCPFGYKCRGGSACVLDEDEEPGRAASTNIVVTRTKTAVVTASTGGETSATGAAGTATTTAYRLPASNTPSASRSQDISTPSTTAPSANEASANASSEKSTSGGVIAGTTVAAVASVAVLTCLLWFKRRSISEKVASAKFPRPWQQLRQNHSEQDVSLPRYNSPPPAYNMATKPHTQQYAFKHYSPDSVGSEPPVELPATPVSFSVWNPRSPREPRQPRRSHYEPYRRP